MSGPRDRSADRADSEADAHVANQGGPDAAGHTTSFKYSETFGPVRDGLELIDYAYGLWSQVGLGALEYNWQPLPWSGVTNAYHIDCQPSAAAVTSERTT
jgi:hypothetical protein